MKTTTIPSIQLILKDNDYNIRIANNLESRREAYQHVYSLYLQRGYAKPNTSHMWLSLFDALPETTTLFVERGGQLIGALTVVLDSPLGLPADSLYKRELDALRYAGHQLTEFISLGVNNGDTRCLVHLFNLAYILTYRLVNATDILITVNPRHVRYYEKMLLFQQEGPERSYEKVGGAPAVLLRLDEVLAEKHIHLEHNPREGGAPISRTLYKRFYSEVKEPALVASLAAARCPMSAEELTYFLMIKTNIWSQANDDQRAYLNRCYSKGSILRELSSSLHPRTTLHHQMD